MGWEATGNALKLALTTPSQARSYLSFAAALGAAPSRCTSGQGAAHHPHPSGVRRYRRRIFQTLDYDRGLDAFFRSVGRQVQQAARGDFRRRVLADRVLRSSPGSSTQSFGGMRQFAPARHGGRGSRHACPRRSRAAATAMSSSIPMLRYFLGAGRFFELGGLRRDRRRQGPGRQAAPTSATASTTPTRSPRSAATSQTSVAAAVSLHPDHGRPRPLRLRLQPARSPCRAADRARTRRCTNTCGASAWPASTMPPCAPSSRAAFPGQPFLIVHYGDHQPFATRSLLGFAENATVEDVVGSGNPRRLPPTTRSMA